MECALLDIRHGTEYTRQEERPLNQQAKKNVWVHLGSFGSFMTRKGTTVYQMPRNDATTAAVN